MIKVYITCCWEDDLSLFETVKKNAFGKTTWKNLEFTTGPDFDRAVILNCRNARSHHITPDKAVAFRMEPPGSPGYLTECDSDIMPGFIHWPFWHKYPPEQLKKVYEPGLIKKKKLFSTVTSDLAYMEGHMERLIFIHHLDKSITGEFDVWGRKTFNNFFANISSYRGELINKYDGLIDYAYHLVVENSFIPDYFTEKIYDPILAECFCFYAGCSNIEEYIDPRAYCKIDLDDKEEAKETVVRAIRDNYRKKNLRYIKQQKQRLLTDLNPLNLIWLALNERDYLKEIKL